MNDAALATTIDTLCGTAAMPPWVAILGRLLQHFDCVVGTVHLLDAGDGLLKLRAHQGLPPPVVDKVAVIPIGKGMAGIAAERREPVQVCNLQALIPPRVSSFVFSLLWNRWTTARRFQNRQSISNRCILLCCEVPRTPAAEL